METRYCNGCDQKRPLNEFAPSALRAYSQCKGCRKRTRLLKAARNRLRGICTICGTRSARLSLTTCQYCADQSAARKQRYKALGLCSTCGREPVENGYANCSACLLKTRVKERQRQEVLKAAGLCHGCNVNPIATTSRAGRCEKCLEVTRLARRAQRQDVIERYGGKCTCCGESNHYFLHIDHVNNDGFEHRLQAGSNNSAFLQIFKEPYSPEKYQLLCSNCNHGKEFYGTCPHTWARIIPLRELKPAMRVPIRTRRFRKTR